MWGPDKTSHNGWKMESGRRDRVADESGDVGDVVEIEAGGMQAQPSGALLADDGRREAHVYVGEQEQPVAARGGDGADERLQDVAIVAGDASGLDEVLRDAHIGDLRWLGEAHVRALRSNVRCRAAHHGPRGVGGGGGEGAAEAAGGDGGEA